MSQYKTFDEWFEENCYNADYLTKIKSEEAWDYQQEKIDDLCDLVAFDTKEMERLHNEKDELQAKIDAVLNLVCKLQYSSGDRIFKEVMELLE